MPRRKDNEIYKYKLKNGKVKYGFKTYIGTDPETGKAVKPSRQGFDSYKEAEAAKTKLKSEGPSKFTHKQKMKADRKTVQQVYDRWLKVYEADVRGSTYTNTTNLWKRNLQKEFGDNYIDSLNVDHIQRFTTELAEKQLTYFLSVNLLHRLVRYAMMRDWCSKDPFDKFIMPKKSKKKSKRPKKNYYELDELKAFLKSIKHYNYMYYAYFMTLGNLGTRPSEALALQWKDIDFDNKLVYITKTVSTDKDGKKTIGPTKTPQSVRTLKMSNNLFQALQDYKKQTVFTKQDDFLFHKRDGDFCYPQAPDDWIYVIYHHDKTLRRITPHGFRHTLATLLYQGDSRIKPQDVQLLLGHSKVTTALNIYTHVTNESKKTIEDSINNLDI